MVRGDVAIIGMACVLPGAPDLDTFWHNIVNKVDAITDVPPDRWDPEIFFDPNSDANDRVYSKRGGYIRYPIRFSPSEYGVIPITVLHGEPEQFLALMVAHQALADAGYLDRPTHRDRTEIIMGRGNYLNRGIFTMLQHVRGAEDALRMIKGFYPETTDEELQKIKAELKSSLPVFNADMASTLIPNLTTGRIANRLDLMGANFTVDAACASSLVAADIGVRDLLTRKCDLVLIGGIYLSNDVGFLSVFCQLHALSRRSQIRPFDKDADGLLIGEGAGCIVLKRLQDAERDGDRIYAVIKGVGTSSDGRAVGVLAPRVEGEELALR
ncbi:MAG TPA: polyketide synthase, partial [Gammaproteobacteria bacterium]|nr:polyketide synthase [Gammaproteobacteria bacterium]